jgi:trigger factor
MSFTYLNLQGKLEHVTATAEDIDRQLQRLLQANPRIIPVTGRAAALGDELVLDYAGFSEGVQFPGGTAEKQTLTLGSGMFIPGFEEQLVGTNIGDDVTVTVTFPTEYHAPELAGKNAEFRCHVHEIRTHDSYQLDDTFAKEIGQCENMEQMRENMGKALQDYYNQRAEQELRWQLMHQAAATVEEQPTDEELDRMVEAQMETLTAQLAQKGLTLEAYCQFTGSDEKKLREDMRPDALEAFRTQKAVEKIAQLENLTVTDEEMDAAIQRICADNHMSAEDLKPYFDNGFLTVVRQQMLRDKATEVVRRSARITQ